MPFSGVSNAKMALEVWKIPTQETHFIMSVVFTPLGVMVTLLRFYATKRAKRKVGFEDWSEWLTLFASH